MVISAALADRGKRLDLFLQEHLPDFSRSRIQQWIKAQQVSVNGTPAKASHLLNGSESVDVRPQAPAALRAEAEDIPIELLYCDADVVAVNKPAGMVIHSGAGCQSGTLVNALLHRFGSLPAGSGEDRPGIVHRLDRYTSGVLLVARNDLAHRSLQHQFAKRTIEKKYLALVQGEMQQEHGRITKPIARDPVRRVRMTTRLREGRSAFTEYRVLTRYERHTYVEVRIATGRTHQIRVHLASVGHPVVGDTLYGAAANHALGRYFLHARSIGFDHPATLDRIKVEAPLPPDLESFLAGL